MANLTIIKKPSGLKWSITVADGPIQWLVKPAVKFYKRTILRDPFLVSVKQWKRDRGDERLRMNYPLTADSVVLDVGGYVGDFASEVSFLFITLGALHNGARYNTQYVPIHSG